jgi:HAD superfamily hydrolase (TIGR01549 family)
MLYKGLLLDIDNTLYDYDSTHEYALGKVVEYCVDSFKLTESVVISTYSLARKKVHIELSETAASHNRLLYFQNLLEMLNVNPLDHGFIIYNIYWDNFLEYMEPFDGVYELLEIYKNKICLITDLTAHIQYRKIRKLKLEKYCNKLVTSEEAGKEKPHPYIFMLALKKLGLQCSEVCMIGDSFKKDITGSSGLDIKSIWLNKKRCHEKYNKNNVVEVSDFNEIVRYL